jgi:hypothetical protein
VGTDGGTLVELTVGDDPAAWRSAGFHVDEAGLCRVGGVRLRLTGAGGARGVLGWALAGVTTEGPIDGLPTSAPHDHGSTGPSASHPNGVVQLDHLVVVTPDLDRTTRALADRGIAARRTREAGGGRRQRFFRLGEVILELVGPAAPAGGGPPSFWGLAFTVANIDATAEHLAGRIGGPRPAVQPGRRIATLRAGHAVSVPVAFLSPDPRGAGDRPGHGDG